MSMDVSECELTLQVLNKESQACADIPYAIDKVSILCYILRQHPLLRNVTH